MFNLRSFAFLCGHSTFKNILSRGLICSILLTGGCATLEGPPNPDDPLERYNRAMFSFNETMDEYVAAPVARGYNYVMPNALNTGVTNFFGNLDDIVVFANSLLQLKFEKATITLARVITNTTIGILGLFDVATHLDAPKHNEDFGQTLAFWGVDSGPYFVLPFLGPSTVRDGLSVPIDWFLFDPIFKDTQLIVSLGLLALRYTDKRAALLTASEIIDTAAPDKYAFIRDAYLQHRNNLEYDGNPPQEFSDEELFGDDLFNDDLNLEKDLK